MSSSLEAPKTPHYRWSIPLLSSLLLLPASLFSMELFHTLVELFSIGVAVMSFVVAWNTHTLAQNRLLLFLGCGYFWVGILDLFHTLTFKNVMNIEGIRPGLTIEYWIVGRFLEALVLLTCIRVASAHYSREWLFFIPTCFALLGIIGCTWELLPAMFSPATGLTDAKIVSEYLVIGLLAVSAAQFLKHETRLGTKTTWLLVASCMFTILAELSFTLYADLNEFPIIVGHVFKLFSFWIVYQILVDASLLRPIESLARVVASYDSVADETAIVDQNGIIRRGNEALRRKFSAEVIGQPCHDVMHPPSMLKKDCPICLAIQQRKALEAFEFKDPESGEWFEARVSGIHLSASYSAMIHSIRNISLRKRHELQYLNLNRLYQVLSHTNQAVSRLPNTDDMLSKVCDIAIEHGGFKMAWIGFIDGNVVSPKYYSGEETGYLKAMQMRIDDSEWAQGPVGISAKEKRVSCVNSVSDDPDFWPWRDAALKRGYAALAAVPIISADKVIAIFTLYSEEEHVFDQEMLKLLESLSEDLSLAIANIQQREGRFKAEQTVAKLSTAIEQSSVATLMADAKGDIEYVNERFCELLGRRPDELIGQSTQLLIPGFWSADEYRAMIEHVQRGDIWQSEKPSQDEEGEALWLLQSASRIELGSKNDPVGSPFVVHASDNTQLHQAKETIEQLAFFDPLTQLPNRRLLMDRIDHAMTSANAHNDLVAVMMCDLDNFKVINDTLGHDAGDALLCTVADQLRACTRALDTVSRLGGDEFVIVLEGLRHNDDIVDIANGILSQLSEPHEITGHTVNVSSSIGIAIAPQDGNDATELLRNADLAMYHAKELGKNGFQFYQAELNEKAQGRLQLENALREALEQNEFHLVYQPQVDIRSGKVCGLEALLRWESASHGMVSPADFIPLAEQTGLIDALGSWVLHQAVSDWYKITQTSGLEAVSMAVNFSAHQFRQSEKLVDQIKNSLAHYPDLAPSRFTVEITESTLIQNIEETRSTLNELKGLGVSISIDDFGTGYSSLNYLKQFPIDQLKIDRSFVQDLDGESNDQAIVSAILAIAQQLKMKVIAEGVEKQAQKQNLIEQGCDYAQGYFFYKPLPYDAITKLGNEKPTQSRGE